MLREVELADGARIVHDSRGLLHVRLGERGAPELTLVLHSGPLAGWTAESGAFGAPFHAPGRAPADPAQVLERLSQLVRRNV